MSGSQFFTHLLGQTVQGRDIVARLNFDPATNPGGVTLLIGGQHGDEPATVRLLESFEAAFAGPEPLAIIAPANPDGLAAASRYNARGVDLNRNCGYRWHPESEEPPGSGPWSEPESVLLRDFILAVRPAKIVSLHWALAELDADGVQSIPLAEAMWAALTPAQRAPYRLRLPELGRGEHRLAQTYSVCPGSLGQWCGCGLEYPDGSRPAMITLELPYDPAASSRPDILADDHLPFVHALWARDSEGYLRATAPGVHAMLVAACRFSTPPAEQAMPRSTVWVMATAVGVIVANIYYAQPLLADMGRTFGLSVTRAGAIAMLSQAGTAVGMFLFVPLGDKFDRRGLILILLVAASVALALMACAPSALWLGAASFAVGAFAANVHVIVPFAAHLAAPAQRGRVVGTVVGGILFGVLLARSFSGTVGELAGWRSVYGIAAGAMLVLAVVVRRHLPISRPEAPLSWVKLMQSTAVLIRRHPLLRESALLGALFFAAFSAFWTTLVFLLGSASYHYENAAAIAGLFGLVGALGAIGAPTVGHLADRHGPRFTIRIALWLALGSFIILGLTGHHLAGLIIGVVLMDLGVQSGHVANQTRIYSLDPTARSRLNMVYMFCYFTGGGIGSYLGACLWHLAGWTGVCALATGFLLIAIIAEAVAARRAFSTQKGKESV
jgi:predicted MFS family arabinose efflux permease